VNGDRLKRVLAFLSDPRVPKLPRLAVVAAIAYLISPVDLVPEMIVPLVGWIDDATMVWLALRWLIKEGDKATTGPAAPPEFPPAARRIDKP
jgi:uncharacterized membrane protein YkvA (DUF1232 family)